MALRHECFHIRKSAAHSLICSYPQLIAAYHVLLRLLMPRHSPYALIRLNFPFCDYLKSLGSLRSLNCLSFIKHFLGYFLFAVKRLFLLCIDSFLSTYRWNCFLPYFYRKTYTNLLIFVLFVCSFFLLFNLSSFIRFSMINQVQSLRLLVGTSGLEPPTSRLSGARSNHLSYAPLWLLLRGSPHVPLVEMMGIEPMTPCLQGRCSPSWATPPLVWVSLFSFF